MYGLIHFPLVLILLALPLSASIAAVGLRKRRGNASLANLLLTGFVGLSIATLVAVAYGSMLNVTMTPSSLFRYAYLATSILLLIKLIDQAVIALLRRLPRAASFLLRGLVLIGCGMPVFMAGLLVYRPQFLHLQDAAINDPGIAPIRFDSKDGIHLAGGWIAASGDRRAFLDAAKYQTIIVCADSVDGSRHVLNVLRAVRRAGFNLLLLDQRGQSNSGGGISSLGARECDDVLGAVHWLKAAHPQAIKKIFAIGISTGAAAVIKAAVDPGADGQAIDAVAVIGGFDSIPATLDTFAREAFSPPAVGHFLAIATLPVASALCGSDLNQLRPASVVDGLWPRPIFVIHAVGDDLIDFDRGRALFDAATFPKARLWVTKDRSGTLDDPSVGRALLNFFQNADPVPAI